MPAENKNPAWERGWKILLDRRDSLWKYTWCPGKDSKSRAETYVQCGLRNFWIFAVLTTLLTQIQFDRALRVDAAVLPDVSR